MAEPLCPCPKRDCSGNLFSAGTYQYQDTQARWVFDEDLLEDVCKDVTSWHSAEAGKCDTCGRHYIADYYGGWEVPVPLTDLHGLERRS